MFELPNVDSNKTKLESHANGLADELKSRTSKLHKMAEKTGVVADILNRSVSLPDYIHYTRNLIPIYQTLEKPLRHTAVTEKLAPFLDSRINRSDFLISDFNNLINHNYWDTLPLTTAATKYKAHIEHVTNTAPLALLGHLYVRYLGDLNGGQLLHRLLAENLELDQSSLNFYRFPEIENIKQYRLKYRDNIDKLSTSSTERKQIINTAIKAFEFNIQISKEVKQQRKLHCAI